MIQIDVDSCTSQLPSNERELTLDLAFLIHKLKGRGLLPPLIAAFSLNEQAEKRMVEHYKRYGIKPDPEEEQGATLSPQAFEAFMNSISK